MTHSSRPDTKRSLLLGWFGLALLAGVVALHMVSCLPGLHEPLMGPEGGHGFAAHAHPVRLAEVVDCRVDQAAVRGLAVMHDGSGHDGDDHHHASCVDAVALGWLEGLVRSMLDLVLAVAASAALLLWSGARRGTAVCRGSPPTDALPSGHWIRHRLRGAMLPAALCVSRT